MPAGERGALMLAWLFAVAAAASLSTLWVARWSHELHREQEADLLSAGDEIAGAIASYRRMSVGSSMKHPPELSDLLDDRRGFGTVRHLRRIPVDPFVPRGDWGIVRAPDGGVAGVYSAGTGQPLLRQARALMHVDLQPARRYADWRFVPREDRP